MPTSLNVEQAVTDRYSAAARTKADALCCPVEFDRQYLKVLPPEILERDYGCGDPSKHLLPGETVLDLGSGAGKICFIASQVVGPTGRVIGVDMNDDMLALARRYQQQVGDAIGWHNVEFRKARIQDLALDLEQLDASFKRHPILGTDAFLAAEARARELRVSRPLVADDAVDVVVSSCVLNLVDPSAKGLLFREIFRVLRKGGRAVISDITSDEPVPARLQSDPVLWSGCISGALTEEGFLQAFADAGFYGIRILRRDAAPWRTVEGIAFRSLTIEAFKGKPGPGLERDQAVIYRGPFQQVVDDEHHCYVRGRRQAVCDKTYQLLKQPPYRECFEFIEPRVEVGPVDAGPFDGSGLKLRHPRETKGHQYDATTPSSQCCNGGNCG